MIPPVYVASKGRPDGRTFQLLRSSGVPFVAFVEPQDEVAYTDHVIERSDRAFMPEELYVLPENDRGLAYVRQHALDHARRERAEWYWMLDDDISGFYRARDGKCEPDTAEAILEEATEALLYIDRRDFLGIGGLEYQQYAWRNEPGKVARNSYCDVAVMIRSGVLARYREELPLKVDRDFTLQVVAGGYDAARLGWLAFAVPTNGSNEGGLHDRYADGIEETASRMMERLWPGICEAKTKPNGRPDVKINWRRARQGATG